MFCETTFQKEIIQRCLQITQIYRLKFQIYRKTIAREVALNLYVESKGSLV